MTRAGARRLPPDHPDVLEGIGKVLHDRLVSEIAKADRSNDPAAGRIKARYAFLRQFALHVGQLVADARTERRPTRRAR